MIDAGKSPYSRIRRYVPALSFLGGGVWDSVALRRIDNPLDLGLLGLYLVLAFVLVVLTCRGTKFRFSEYSPAVLQFLFGGLFSAFRVYYFQSAASLSSLLFMGALVALLLGNEFLRHKLTGTLALALFGICCVMYLTFFLPVVLHAMNALVFLAGVAIAFAIVLLGRFLIGGVENRLTPVGVIYALMMALYFANAIPPVPLAVKHIGIYRSVEKTDGAYVCLMEKPRWFEVWRKGEKEYRYRPGDAVYCFTAVFAPTRLTQQIYHHWYYRGADAGAYRDVGRVGYGLAGGRDEGYRGYTYKKAVSPGKWRVEVETEDGRTLAVQSFTLVPDDGLPLELSQVIY